jgi:hypothetical protein
MIQTWLEMRDLRRRLDTASWIPLRASETLERVGEHDHLGFQEEFHGAGSVAFPVQSRAVAERLGWDDVGTRLHTEPCVDEGKYFPADTRVYDDGLVGLSLVLVQTGNRAEVPEWYLHQDLVLALGLRRGCGAKATYGSPTTRAIPRSRACAGTRQGGPYYSKSAPSTSRTISAPVVWVSTLRRTGCAVSC